MRESAKGVESSENTDNEPKSEVATAEDPEV